MAPNLKRRLLGAFITIMLVVVMLPVILDKTRHMEALPSDVPPMPDIPEWAEVTNEQRVRVELSELASGEAEEKLKRQPRPVVSEDATAVETIADSQAGLDATHTGVEWVIQLGAFNERASANAYRDSLRKKGYKAFADELSHQGLVRVYVGPEIKRENIESLQKQLQKELGQQDIFIKRWIPGQ